MRIVIELKRDAIADVVLNQLWRHSDLQTDVRRQHAGDQRRPARAAQPQGHHLRLHGLPRGGGEPAHQAPAGKVARPRARVGRPGRRGRQHRRDDPADPQRAEPGGGARADDGARLAGQGHRPAGRADRRPAPPLDAGRHHPPLRRAGPRHPRSAPAAPHRARPRRDRRRAEEARRGDQGLPGDPVLARPHRRHHQEGAQRHQGRVRHARASPRSSRWRARSRTRT